MAAGKVDSRQCFSQLTENLPTWITRITELASHTAAKHAEFTADYAKLSKTESKPRRRRNSSLHTHRDDEQQSSGSQTSTTPTTANDPFVDPITLKRLSRQHSQDLLHRKRRSDIEPDKPIRHRNNVVIHYDSHTQSILEKLVRDIGGARNNIRKGKMNHMMKFDFSRRSFQSNLLMGDDAISKPGYRVSRSNLDPKTNGKKSSQSGDSPFDLTDKQLEQAQGVCETAAHLFIRHGDCSRELNKAKERLSSALELAKMEMERLNEAKAEEEEEGSTNTMEIDLKPTPRPNTMELKATGPEKMSAHIGAIEVDDASTTSSISIDLTAFRTARYGRV